MSGVSWSWLGKGTRAESDNRISYTSAVRHQGENEKRTFHVGDAVVVRNEDDETWFAHLIALYDDHGAQIPGSKASPTRMRCDLRWFYDPMELGIDERKHSLFFSDHIDLQMNSVYTIHGLAWLFQTLTEADEFREHPADRFLKQADEIRVVERYYDISRPSLSPTRKLRPGELKVLLANPSSRPCFARARRVSGRAATKSAPLDGRVPRENAASSSSRSRKRPRSSSPEKLEVKPAPKPLTKRNEAKPTEKIDDGQESLPKSSINRTSDSVEVSDCETPENHSSSASTPIRSLPRRHRRWSALAAAKAAESTSSESSYERHLRRSKLRFRRRVVAESDDDSDTLSDTLFGEDGTKWLAQNDDRDLGVPHGEQTMSNDDSADFLHTQENMHSKSSSAFSEQSNGTQKITEPIVTQNGMTSSGSSSEEVTQEEQPPLPKRRRVRHGNMDNEELPQKELEREVVMSEGEQGIEGMPTQSPEELALKSVLISKFEGPSQLGRSTREDKTISFANCKDLLCTANEPAHGNWYDADGEVTQERQNDKSDGPESPSLENAGRHAVTKDDMNAVFTPDLRVRKLSNTVYKQEPTPSPRRVTEAPVPQTDISFTDAPNAEKPLAKSETLIISNGNDTTSHSSDGDNELGNGTRTIHKAEVLVNNNNMDESSLDSLDDMHALLTRAPEQTQHVVLNNLEGFFDAAVEDVLEWCEGRNGLSGSSTENMPDDVAERITRRALVNINLLPSTSR